MATDKQFDEVVSRWLEEAAPTRLPERTLDATFERTRRTSQQFGLRALLRRLHVGRFAPLLGGAAVVVVAAALAVSLNAGQQGVAGPSTPTPTPSPTPTPRPLPASIAISAGTYLYDHHAFTIVPFTFTVPEGWVVENGGWNIYNADRSDIGFASATLDTIYADNCTGMDGELVDAGSTVDDLTNALLDQTGPAVAVEGPVDVTVGGYSGKRVDLTAPAASALEGCSVPGLQLWRDEAGNWFVVLADGQSSIYILDVDGDRVVLMTQHQTSASAADVAELEAVIESIEFQP